MILGEPLTLVKENNHAHHCRGAGYAGLTAAYHLQNAGHQRHYRKQPLEQAGWRRVQRERNLGMAS
jgi:hypothetical protein